MKELIKSRPSRISNACHSVLGFDWLLLLRQWMWQNSNMSFWVLFRKLFLVNVNVEQNRICNNWALPFTFIEHFKFAGKLLCEDIIAFDPFWKWVWANMEEVNSFLQVYTSFMKDIGVLESKQEATTDFFFVTMAAKSPDMSALMPPAEF